MGLFYRFRPDEFTIAMLTTVLLAFLLPCHGASAGFFASLTGVAIALLFFLQGAQAVPVDRRLSAPAARMGSARRRRNWSLRLWAACAPSSG